MFKALSKHLVVCLVLPSLILGGLFVVCHFLTDTFESQIDRPVVVEAGECCLVQSHQNETRLAPAAPEQPLVRLVLRDHAGAAFNLFESVIDTRKLAADSSVRLYFDHNPVVKLRSYLVVFLSQGLLSPRIYDLA